MQVVHVRAFQVSPSRSWATHVRVVITAILGAWPCVESRRGLRGDVRKSLPAVFRPCARLCAWRYNNWHLSVSPKRLIGRSGLSVSLFVSPPLLSLSRALGWLPGHPQAVSFIQLDSEGIDCEKQEKAPSLLGVEALVWSGSRSGAETRRGKPCRATHCASQPTSWRLQVQGCTLHAQMWTHLERERKLSTRTSVYPEIVIRVHRNRPMTTTASMTAMDGGRTALAITTAGALRATDADPARAAGAGNRPARAG